MSANYPDGITAHNLGSRTSRWRFTHWIALLILGAIMTLALSGVLGGRANHTISHKEHGTNLRVDAPQTLRSGEFFEIGIEAWADRAIERPTIAISVPFWRNFTVNTMIPQAEGEEASDGAFAFTYGPIEPGKKLVVKIDGQVNPTLRGGNSGWLELRDGDRAFTRIPLKLKVLP